MFVRKNRNRSGSTSVQIIAHPKNQLKLLPLKSQTDLVVETFVQTLSNSQVHTIGPELIFGTLFDRIGFNVIPDELFRHITVARLVYPTSKLKTVDYLYRYRGIRTSKDNIYRFLDNLNHKYKRMVEDISYQYTKKRLKTTIICGKLKKPSGSPRLT